MSSGSVRCWRKEGEPPALLTGPRLDLPPSISHLEGLGEKVQHRGSDPRPEQPAELRACCGPTHPTHRFYERVQCSWREKESVRGSCHHLLSGSLESLSASHLTLRPPRNLPVPGAVFPVTALPRSHLPWIPITCKINCNLLHVVYTSL